MSWHLQRDRSVSRWCADEPRGEVDACLLTRRTGIGPINDSGRLLEGGVGVNRVVAAERNLRKDGDVSEQRGDELRSEEGYQE
jgi:hypothetical protein